MQHTVPPAMASGPLPSTGSLPLPVSTATPIPVVPTSVDSVPKFPDLSTIVEDRELPDVPVLRSAHATVSESDFDKKLQALEDKILALSVSNQVDDTRRQDSERQNKLLEAVVSLQTRTNEQVELSRQTQATTTAGFTSLIRSIQDQQQESKIGRDNQVPRIVEGTLTDAELSMYPISLERDKFDKSYRHFRAYLSTKHWCIADVFFVQRRGGMACISS